MYSSFQYCLSSISYAFSILWPSVMYFSLFSPSPPFFPLSSQRGLGASSMCEATRMYHWGFMSPKQWYWLKKKFLVNGLRWHIGDFVLPMHSLHMPCPLSRSPHVVCLVICNNRLHTMLYLTWCSALPSMLLCMGSRHNKEEFSTLSIARENQGLVSDLSWDCSPGVNPGSLLGCHEGWTPRDSWSTPWVNNGCLTSIHSPRTDISLHFVFAFAIIVILTKPDHMSVYSVNHGNRRVPSTLMQPTSCYNLSFKIHSKAKLV